MRKGMLVNLSNCFLCLVVAFLMLSSPLAGKAQNTSVVNVAGTSWDAGSVLMPTPNTGDGSLMTRRRLYDFDKQGKVKSTVLIDTSAGGVLKYEYNALSGRYENRYEMTMPTSRSETITGTYEIKGKSIYLDFPDYTVRATIYSNSMKGVLTYKGTNAKEEWVIGKTAKDRDKPTPIPVEPRTKQEQFDASMLVGTWDGEITENGYPQNITWQVNADGTDVILFSSEYGTSPPIRSRWRYVDGVLYEEGPTGSASGRIRWIDNNHIEITIIQNQDGLSSRGRTRHFYRRTR